MDTIVFNNKTYNRYSNKWVDENGMVAHQSLQNELNKTFYDSVCLASMNVEELVAEGDNCKENGSFILAVKYYESALEVCDQKTYQYILPKISSCYRKCHSPQKAIELFTQTKQKYGTSMINAVLLTTAAAAYCDIDEFENARKCANKAYAKYNGKCPPELISVLARIKKELGESN